MKQSQKRIPPLQEDEWTDGQRRQLEGAYRKGGFYNLAGTMARYPEASKRIGQLSAHVLGPTSTLPARDRELLILRTAWLCQAEYEWAQHRLIGRKVGISDEEIERCSAGSDAPGWAPLEASLLRAAEDLNAHQKIDDANWATLAKTYSEQQMMDIVFAVGQYTLVAMAMNSFGTPLDEGLQGF
jgi:4-carboxymuconolactone decarboxylase